MELCERGQLRGGGTVVWSRIQANVQESQPVLFPLSTEKTNAHTMVTEDQLRKTFSIKVHEHCAGVSLEFARLESGPTPSRGLGCCVLACLNGDRVG